MEQPELSSLSSETRFVVRHPAVTWDEIGGEIVAINLESGHYFSLRGTARDLFVMWDSGHSVREALELLPDTAGRDVGSEMDGFTRQLIEHGLIEVQSDENADGTRLDRSGSPDQISLVATEYSMPMLEIYTDLEDLMLLDPVHDVGADGWPRAAADTM